MSAAGAGATAGVSRSDRRRFIAAALAFSTGALVWRGAGASAVAGGAAVDVGTSALLGTLSARAAAARIGTAYLAAQRQTPTPDLLVQELGQALAAAQGSIPTTPEAMLAALTGLVEAEYCGGRLVRADGWLLAPSEARLYALAALAGGTDDAPDP